MSDQVMHCMPSSLKQGFCQSADIKKKKKEKKLCKKKKKSVRRLRGKTGVQFLVGRREGSDDMLPECELNALCSSDVAPAVCGHMTGERG